LLRRGLFMPWELKTILGADIARRGLSRLNPLGHISNLINPRPRLAFGKVAVLESAMYMRNQLLRDTDWASMAHSLEVRVPLVDAKLLGHVAPITAKHGSMSKRMLGLSPSIPLSSPVLDRPKTGFQTPIQSWLQRDRRIQGWRRIPTLATDNCAWARRWAFHMTAA